MAAGSPLGPVQLHNLFLVGMKEPGQASAIAAGAFDRPHPLAVVLVGELGELPVAGWGGWHGQVGQGLAGGCGHDRGGMGVLVGVDADDDLDGVCLLPTRSQQLQQRPIGCVETAEHAAVAALAPVELRGSAFGLLAAVQGFGNLAASAIAGLLWTLASPRVASPISSPGCCSPWPRYG